MRPLETLLQCLFSRLRELIQVKKGLTSSLFFLYLKIPKFGYVGRRKTAKKLGWPCNEEEPKVYKTFHKLFLTIIL